MRTDIETLNYLKETGERMLARAFHGAQVWLKAELEQRETKSITLNNPKTGLVEYQTSDITRTQKVIGKRVYLQDRMIRLEGTITDSLEEDIPISLLLCDLAEETAWQLMNIIVKNKL